MPQDRHNPLLQQGLLHRCTSGSRNTPGPPKSNTLALELLRKTSGHNVLRKKKSIFGLLFKCNGCSYKILSFSKINSVNNFIYFERIWKDFWAGAQGLGRGWAGAVLSPHGCRGMGVAWLGSSKSDSFSPDVWPDVLGLVLLSEESILSSCPKRQIWANCGFPGWAAAMTTAFTHVRIHYYLWFIIQFSWVLVSC